MAAGAGSSPKPLGDSPFPLRAVAISLEISLGLSLGGGEGLFWQKAHLGPHCGLVRQWPSGLPGPVWLGQSGMVSMPLPASLSCLGLSWPYMDLTDTGRA